MVSSPNESSVFFESCVVALDNTESVYVFLSRPSGSDREESAESRLGQREAPAPEAYDPLFAEIFSNAMSDGFPEIPVEENVPLDVGKQVFAQKLNVVLRRNTAQIGLSNLDRATGIAEKRLELEDHALFPPPRVDESERSAGNCPDRTKVSEKSASPHGLLVAQARLQMIRQSKRERDEGQGRVREPAGGEHRASGNVEV